MGSTWNDWCDGCNQIEPVQRVQLVIWVHLDGAGRHWDSRGLKWGAGRHRPTRIELAELDRQGDLPRQTTGFTRADLLNRFDRRLGSTGQGLNRPVGLVPVDWANGRHRSYRSHGLNGINRINGPTGARPAGATGLTGSTGSTGPTGPYRFNWINRFNRLDRSGSTGQLAQQDRLHLHGCQL